MKLRKILIVDSNDVNRQILLRILSDEYEVLEARSGAESLCLLKTTHESISAVLLDTLMPQEDGYQLLSSMRADPKLTPIPVIVTADSSETDAEIRALSLGAHDFIRKPYNPAAIKHRLRNRIHRRETS